MQEEHDAKIAKYYQDRDKQAIEAKRRADKRLPWRQPQSRGGRNDYDYYADKAWWDKWSADYEWHWNPTAYHGTGSGKGYWGKAKGRGKGQSSYSKRGGKHAREAEESEPTQGSEGDNPQPKKSRKRHGGLGSRAARAERRIALQPLAHNDVEGEQPKEEPEEEVQDAQDEPEVPATEQVEDTLGTAEMPATEEVEEEAPAAEEKEEELPADDELAETPAELPAGDELAETPVATGRPATGSTGSLGSWELPGDFEVVENGPAANVTWDNTVDGDGTPP